MTLALAVLLLTVFALPALPLPTGRLRVPSWVGVVGTCVWMAGWWWVL